MTIPLQWQEIALSQIDMESVAPEGMSPDLERLTASMRDVGLLNPPWLRPRPGGARFQVVTGVRRLQAAHSLGWERLMVRLLPQDTPDRHCLLIHLMDNAFTRGFNLREQALLAVRLLDHEDRQTVAARYLPYLGLPPSPAHLERLIKTAGLEPPWQRLAAQGRLALTAAARLADWDPASRAAAWPFLEGLRLSQSKQEEFLDQVALLARRQGISPAAVLAEDALGRCLTDPDLPPAARLEAVRGHLYTQVYPRLSAAREAFDAALTRLGWKRHPRLRLQPPAVFEGPDFNLEIKFRDAPELQQLLDEILRLTSSAEFAHLTGPAPLSPDSPPKPKP